MGKSSVGGRCSSRQGPARHLQRSQAETQADHEAQEEDDDDAIPGHGAAAATVAAVVPSAGGHAGRDRPLLGAALLG